MATPLEALFSEHAAGKHSDPRADCFACFRALQDRVTQLQEALVAIGVRGGPGHWTHEIINGLGLVVPPYVPPDLDA